MPVDAVYHSCTISTSACACRCPTGITARAVRSAPVGPNHAVSIGSATSMLFNTRSPARIKAPKRMVLGANFSGIFVCN